MGIQSCLGPVLHITNHLQPPNHLMTNQTATTTTYPSVADADVFASLKISPVKDPIDDRIYEVLGRLDELTTTGDLLSAPAPETAGRILACLTFLRILLDVKTACPQGYQG